MARKWPILVRRPGELHHRRNENRLFFPFENSKRRLCCLILQRMRACA